MMLLSTQRLIGFIGRNRGKVAILGFHFGASKAIAFFGPLAIAAVLDATSYAALELALSWGTLLAFAASLGIPSSYPQLALLRRPVAAEDILGLQLSAALLLSLAMTAVAGAIGGARPALVCAITALAMAQATLSIVFRTTSKRELSAWSTSLVLIVSSAVTLVAWHLGRANTAGLALGHAIVVALALPGAVNWMWTARAPDLRKRFQRALDLALPLLASGCVTLWLAASGRILIGHFLTERELAIYAFDMRVAGAAVVIHQLVLMVWFARLYRMRTRQFDRFASLYLAGTALIALMITALFPLLLSLFHWNAIGSADHSRAAAVMPAIGLQVFLMNFTAALELRINRLRLARQSAGANLIVAFAIVLAMGLTAQLQALSFAVAVWMVTLQWLLVALSQLVLLARRRLPMPLMLATLLFVCAMMAAFGALI